MLDKLSVRDLYVSIDEYPHIAADAPIAEAFSVMNSALEAHTRYRSMLVHDNDGYFLDDEEFRETDRPGFRRRVITGDHLQLCFWRIAGGATGAHDYRKLAERVIDDGIRQKEHSRFF